MPYITLLRIATLSDFGSVSGSRVMFGKLSWSVMMIAAFLLPEMMLFSRVTSSAAIITTPVPDGTPETMEPGAPKFTWLLLVMKLLRMIRS